MTAPAAGPLARHWALEPATDFLNHGSFGACPTPALAAQAELRARLEAQPVRFLARELEPALDDARAALAAFVRADADDLAFVPNATHGVNTVLRSLRFRRGDELLTNVHEYHAAANALRAAAERDGARVVLAELPFPTADEDELAEALLARVTPRTRLALLSHVTSPKALVLPVARLARALAGRGVEVFVDGAHAPGMLPLDLRELAAAGASYYTGNAHKWLCAPKGSAFLWVRPDRQAGIRPLAISHRADSLRANRSRFRLEFDWTGTADPTAYLAIPAAVAFMGSLLPGGWPALMAASRALVLAGRARLLAALGVPSPAPAALLGSMAAVPLPPHAAWPAPGAAALALAEDPLQVALRERWAIEVPIVPWPPNRPTPGLPAGRLVRISAQVYNEIGQHELLAGALAELLGRRESKSRATAGR